MSTPSGRLWGGRCKECAGSGIAGTGERVHRCQKCGGTGFDTPAMVGWYVTREDMPSGRTCYVLRHEDIDGVAWRIHDDDSCETIDASDVED